ncbi:MAG: DUF5916 domain-containing protein [Pseudomonadales bacterium]
MAIVFSVLMLLFFSPRALAVETSVAPALKGTLDGIPMHQLTVPTLKHSDVAVKIDGQLDEAVWATLSTYDNMIVAVPGTGEPGQYPTRTRLFATKQGLYVGVAMTQPQNTLVRRMTNRDEFIDRDTIGVTLDTTGQGLFGYWFTLALGDSQMDGKVLPERRYSNDWDGIWIGKSAITDVGWNAELFFPWSMMNLPNSAGPRQIGFAISRQVSHANQRYQWPGHAYSSPQFVTALNSMELENVSRRPQYSLIPYLSTTVDRARDDVDSRLGLDLAWKPSPMFEVSAALNPDFGAVEADDVVLNLTALETFFPEKRLFFLEGNEVFATTQRANSGNELRIVTNENFATTSRRVFMQDNLQAPISMINTRRIGGTANQVAVPAGVTPLPGETDLPTELLGAAKFTGNLAGLRYGVLGAFEDDVHWQGSDAAGNPVPIEASGRDFAALRLIQEWVGSNRYGIGYLGTQTSGPLYDATVHGIDLHHASGDGRWTSDVQLLHSEVDDVSGKGALYDLGFTPSSSQQHRLQLDYFDEQIDINDLGFLSRNDYASAQYVWMYARAQPWGWLQGTRGAVTLRQAYNISEGQVVDSGLYWRNTTVLGGRNTLRTGVGYLPERFEDVDSRGNGAYRTEDRVWTSAIWSTDASNVASYSFEASAFQEDLGDWTYRLATGVTLRPSERFYMDIDLRYTRRDGWLVYQGGREFGAYDATEWQPTIGLTWFLAARHQLRASLQWVGVKARTQALFTVPAKDGDLVPTNATLDDYDFTVSLVTAQLRYRWEIAPLTDFYLVYNRGNRLPSRMDSDFGDLFSDVFRDPIVDSFIAKLRYRFGN